MHDQVRDFVAECIQRHGPFYGAAEVGARDINGGVRDLFHPDTAYWGYDLQDGPGVNEVCDFTQTDLPESCDCVICCEVLEHAENAPRIILKAYYTLKPGGTLIVTCAGPARDPHSAIDQNPIRPDEYYRNPTQQDLEHWLETAGFEEFWVQTVRAGNDLQAWAKKPGLGARVNT